MYVKIYRRVFAILFGSLVEWYKCFRDGGIRQIHQHWNSRLSNKRSPFDQVILKAVIEQSFAHLFSSFRAKKLCDNCPTGNDGKQFSGNVKL